MMLFEQYSGDRISGCQAGVCIRTARQRAGRTLRGLASDLGVSPATLSHLENGRTRVSLDRLAQVACALGISVPDVLGISKNDACITVSSTTPQSGPPFVRLPAEDSVHTANWRHYAPLEFDPVLRAALVEFVLAGYHGTSVRDIARRSALSVSGIYHYYSSKQEMLKTLLQAAGDELLWRSEAARQDGNDPRERFCLLIEHLALFCTYRLDLAFVGTREKRSLTSENRRTIGGMCNEHQRMVDFEVEAALQSGYFATDHPHEAARAVVTMCTALPTWFKMDGPNTPEDIAAKYVHFGLKVMHHTSFSSFWAG